MKRDDVPLELELDENLDTRTPIEKEEDWLYFHLDCAQRARRRLEKLQPGQQFDHELHTRRLAVFAAMKHMALLARMHSPIPPLLEQMLRSEGL
jgi:hypothetical protein